MSRFALLLVGVLAVFGARTDTLSLEGGDPGARAEVVVLLDAPALAHEPRGAATIAEQQRAFRRALAAAVPSARVGWRYRVVVNGLSVSLPRRRVARLRALPGVRDVLSSAAYRPQLSETPGHIGAPALWGPTLDSAGQGVKIGIIDTGVDPSHPFFDPAGYEAPAGFPKGQSRFTSAKIIVARAFAPRGTPDPGARLAFDPANSNHGTHVAGIAAGNAQTRASGGRVVSGVAPRAFLGNYKVFTRRDSGVESIENAAELVAAIEAAVRDGMDVINLSLGEPEIEPTRNVVALALDGAAAAGVVPVVAGGNEYTDVGAGSVSSPASAANAIAVGAVEIGGGTPLHARHADFSSVGPATVSLLLKPDVAAPGVGVVSSVPDGWAASSGTSMASPHVAGAAALLVQRHPTWTVAQVKSALVLSGTDALGENGDALSPPFQGGGLVSLPRADVPLLFAEPTSISLGLLRPGNRLHGEVQLSDAGGGLGPWALAVVRSTASTGRANIILSPAVDVPGVLSYDIAVPTGARQGELTGYVELRRSDATRRIPFWGRVSVAALQRHRPVTLSRAGTYSSSTRGHGALVSRYRYPEDVRGIGLTAELRGPERVYRVRLTRRVANFGVVVTRRGPESRVEPRLVAGLDENRLTGWAGLPIARNPYLDPFLEPVLAVAAISPIPGEYGIVFDSPNRATAGGFSFRYWVNDVTPPVLRLRTRSAAAGRPVLVAARDAGSGVWPDSILATIDGERGRAVFRNGVVSISTTGLRRGKHRLRLRVSDYQESKNSESVPGILPNTRTVTFSFRLR